MSTQVGTPYSLRSVADQAGRWSDAWLRTLLAAAYHQGAAGLDLDLDDNEMVADLERLLKIASWHCRDAADRMGELERRLEGREEAIKKRVRSLIIESWDHDQMPDPHGFYVYILHGHVGAGYAHPIYIGQSSNIYARLGAHLSDREKRSRITRITITGCKTHAAMMRLEAELIEQYQPPLNKVGIR